MMGLGMSEALGPNDATANDLYLIDVREPDELVGNNIPKAINIPSGQVASRIEKEVPDKNAKIRLFCASGGRASRIKSMLLNMGYTDVRNLGGIGTARTTLANAGL